MSINDLIQEFQKLKRQFKDIFISPSQFAKTPETAPTEDYEVANKKYVDDNAGGGGLSYLEYTYAELTAAITGSDLIPGTLYKISNRGDRGLFFQAISTNQLAKNGTRLMLCPARYSTNETDGSGNVWKGVWNINKSAATNDLMIYGGNVWKNLTGNIGTSESGYIIALDSTNWVLVSKTSFTNSEYVELKFGCSYDVANDWIEKQWDSKNNVFGIDYELEQITQWGINLCDISDWNYGANNDGYLFYNNNSLGVFNNSCQSIYDNYCPAGIYGNLNSGEIGVNIILSDIKNNSNTGSISSNRCLYIINNENSGHIQQNIIQGSVNNNTSNVSNITKNTNHGDIQANSNTGIITNNSNRGSINSNENLGDISGNSNNGSIISIGAANASIINNTNNGIISTTTTGNISDATVNK